MPAATDATATPRMPNNAATENSTFNQPKTQMPKNVATNEIVEADNEPNL